MTNQRPASGRAGAGKAEGRAESARSVWVWKEVECWLGGHPAENFLIVLTGGELAWDAVSRGFDWVHTDALPVGLRGALRTSRATLTSAGPDHLDYPAS
ncbi:MAG TPA: hypothetical protein VK421_07250 [Pyrinomonadaceae bacterium]|nr:hypothetical protein [Pyrinomonadaceae bacterium]